jgi:hypothetical protein
MAVQLSNNEHGLKARFKKVLRLKPSLTHLPRRPATALPETEEFLGQQSWGDDIAKPIVYSSALQAHRAKYKEYNQNVNSQTGERKDVTELLHSLTPRGLNNADAFEASYQPQKPSRPGDEVINILPASLWDLVISFLDPDASASLAFSCKSFLGFLGPEVFSNLNLPENLKYKWQFLLSQDEFFPSHLLCFLCAQYHKRTHPGDERLKPPGVLNPLYHCPNDRSLPAPRTRLTPLRNIPFSFVQLATRAQRYGDNYGIHFESLSRRWKETNWSHQTRYCYIKNHLYLRVISNTFAPGGLTESEQRILLFSRHDYTPYFSACAHWRDGELMKICKCVLNHIPAPRELGGLSGLGTKAGDRLLQRRYDADALVSLCQFCRLIRRCPECPSEYQVHLTKIEDVKNGGFRRTIVVTRWCDLGDGRSSEGAEWAAGNGVGPGYDSIKAAGSRGISGMFEAEISDTQLPGQSIVSLNPKMVKAGEEGDEWY